MQAAICDLCLAHYSHFCNVSRLRISAEGRPVADSSRFPFHICGKKGGKATHGTRKKQKKIGEKKEEEIHNGGREGEKSHRPSLASPLVPLLISFLPPSPRAFRRFSFAPFLFPSFLGLPPLTSASGLPARRLTERPKKHVLERDVRQGKTQARCRENGGRAGRHLSCRGGLGEFLGEFRLGWGRKGRV